MKLPLDTHALPWWFADDPQLGTQARALIVDPGNEVMVSKASHWEIEVKLRVGKLAADIYEITTAVQRDSFTSLDIAILHLRALSDLPMRHRDPFDHFLVAQAMTEKAIFVSEGRHAAQYPVRVVPCSDTPARRAVAFHPVLMV